MTESQENYIKTIYVLGKRLGYVRGVDVAAELGFSRPSVSHAVGALKRRGLLVSAADGGLELTPEGLRLAEALCARYDGIARLMSESLGVDPETARAYACRMEHILSTEAVERWMERGEGDERRRNK